MGEKEYRKKPVVIKAYQAEKDGEIKTLEGVMQYRKGDYIITGVKGEQYACREDIFKETYELVEPLQNGEREEQLKDKIDDIVDDCIEWEESWDGEEESAHKFLNKPSFKDQIFHLIKEELSQSKKEELEYLIEEYGEVDTPYLSMLPHEIPEERERLERLTNQKKDI